MSNDYVNIVAEVRNRCINTSFLPRIADFTMKKSQREEEHSAAAQMPLKDVFIRLVRVSIMPINGCLPVTQSPINRSRAS